MTSDNFKFAAASDTSLSERMTKLEAKADCRADQDANQETDEQCG
jgi:hypothetical protein